MVSVDLCAFLMRLAPLGDDTGIEHPTPPTSLIPLHEAFVSWKPVCADSASVPSTGSHVMEEAILTE